MKPTPPSESAPCMWFLDLFKKTSPDSVYLNGELDIDIRVVLIYNGISASSEFRFKRTAVKIFKFAR